MPIPLFVKLTLVWLKSRLSRRRTYPCAEHRLPLGRALRVDAKAEGNAVAVGGWAPKIGEDGRVDKLNSPWFMVRLDEETAPWAFAKGEPFKTIMALELFATTAAVALFGPQLLGSRPSAGTVVLPSVADNQGSTFVVSKGTSTKYPLCLVAMELSSRLETLGAKLECEWVPRELNQEADDLSNFISDGFAPALRVGGLAVIPHLMSVAQMFYMDQVPSTRRTSTSSEDAAGKGKVK